MVALFGVVGMLAMGGDVGKERARKEKRRNGRRWAWNMVDYDGACLLKRGPCRMTALSKVRPSIPVQPTSPYLRRTQVSAFARSEAIEIPVQPTAYSPYRLYR
jgi:hypothetical protein